MRGKLRDKHTKHDSFKRPAMERKRPGKRDTRIAILLDQELDEQVLEEMLEDDNNESNNGNEQADQPLIRITKLTQK